MDSEDTAPGEAGKTPPGNNASAKHWLEYAGRVEKHLEAGGEVSPEVGRSLVRGLRDLSRKLAPGL